MLNYNKMRIIGLTQKRIIILIMLQSLFSMANVFAQHFTDYKLSVFHEGMAAYEKTNGKWGYIDRSGNRIIPCIYDDARRFSEGLAAVKKNGCYGYIDKYGNTKIPFQFMNPYPFHEGLAYVYLNGEYVVIDKDGKVIFNLPKTNEGFLPFSEGWAIVKPDPFTCYYIDKQGKRVTKVFFEARPFSEGLAAVCDKPGGRWGYIDKSGEIVIPCQYTTARPFREGLAAVDGGYIDKSGAWVIPPKYQETTSFENGFALVIEDRTTVYVINKSGRVLGVYTNTYDNFTKAMGFSNGIALVCNDVFEGKAWLAINTKGTKLTNDTWLLSHKDMKYERDKTLLEFNDWANECLFRAEEDDDLALCYRRPKWNEITYYYMDKHGNSVGSVGSNLKKASYITIESKECDITIDGKAVGRNRWTGELKKGKHAISVTKACYEPYEETITIDGEITTFKITPNRLKKRSLNVSCNVDNCNIEIDGQIKTINSDNPLSLNLEMERIHTISFEAPNYVPIAVSFSILEDQIVYQDPKGLISYNGEQSSIVKSDQKGISICLKKLDKRLYYGNDTQYKQRPDYHGPIMGMDRIRVKGMSLGSEMTWCNEYFGKSRFMYSWSIGLALLPGNEEASILYGENTAYEMPVEYFIGVGLGWQIFEGARLRITPQIGVYVYSFFDDPYVAVCPKVNISYPISDSFIIGITPMMGNMVGHVVDMSPVEGIGFLGSFYGLSLSLGWQKRK